MDEVYIPLPSQRKLLSLARQTLQDFVQKTIKTRLEIDDSYLQMRGRGVFVSLYKKRELRGCIGNITRPDPLYQSVIDMTRAAASRDRRVRPVCASELTEIDIRISILSPFKPIAEPSALEIGKHGLYIVRGSRRGILLPQVASEYRWKAEAFLEQACIKAGLCKDAWRDGATEISSFTSLVIEERAWNVAVLSDS
jgi:AmmeMemoRadiSam system protein A